MGNESASNESVDIAVVINSAVIMFSTSWCGYCQRLKAQMKRAGIEYTEIDIEADPDSAAFVASVNGGNEVVPTLKFSDGTTLTNPPIAEVVAKVGQQK